MNKSLVENLAENLCPRCHSARLRSWHELSADEKILAEKMPLSTSFVLDERKRHRFCVKCWLETNETNPEIC